jgi:nitrous oxidase accessory protein NosD
MSLIGNIKNYFTKKVNNQSAGDAPEGICPNCWGKQEWEGEFYTLNKGNKLVGYDQTYNNFINKIVEKNVSGISINEDTYKCETCEISYT